MNKIFIKENESQRRSLLKIVMIITLCGVIMVSVFPSVKAKAISGEPSAYDLFLQEQAAIRDYELFIDYLNNHKDSQLYHHFGGSYLTENKQLVVSLSCHDDNCRQILDNMAFETEIIFTKCEGSYYENMATLEKINERIWQINQSVLQGSSIEKEIRLMSYFPGATHDHLTNMIHVNFVVEDENNLSYAVALFEELIGVYQPVQYVQVDKNKMVGTYQSSPLQPGCGIQIANDIYSLGFRVSYDYDGETHQGFVTAAHGVSIGDTVYLRPYSYTIASIGIVDRRWLSNTIDASFVDVTNGNYYCSNDIYYTSYYHDGYFDTLSVRLNGLFGTLLIGTDLYKSGRATQVTKGSVNSLTGSAYLNGNYMSDLIESYMLMTNYGDCGGVAFRLNSWDSSHSRWNASIFGIVTGEANNASFFTKGFDLCGALEVVPY